MATSFSPESPTPSGSSATERIRRAVSELHAVEAIFQELASRRPKTSDSIPSPEVVLELQRLVDQLRQVIRRYLEATASAFGSARERLEDYRMLAVMQLIGLLHPRPEEYRGTFTDEIEKVVDRQLHLLKKPKPPGEAA